MAPGNPGTTGQTSPFIATSGAPIPKGSIVFSPDGLEALRRLDEGRERRNRKRGERREKGEKDVSEDEPDELAPFLVVVPSGDKAGPSPPETAALEVPVGPNSTSTATSLLFQDSVAEKNSFKAHDNSIPEAVHSLAKNGISPPLTLFLPTSLARIRSGNARTVKHGTGETTKVNVIDVSEFPDEETLG